MITVKSAEVFSANKAEIYSTDESETSVLCIVKVRVGIDGMRDSSRKALGIEQIGVIFAMRVELREVVIDGRKRVVAGKLKRASDMLGGG